MNVITHALLPVVAIKAARPSWNLARIQWIAIGMAGALPDLLNPHLTLDQRMQSWSHGLPFFGLWSAAVLTACLLSRGRLSPALASMLCGAYLLHLACDSISGGINWLHPLGSFVWGEFWVHPLWWIPLDVACFLAAYHLFRLRPLLQKQRDRRSRQSAGSGADLPDSGS